MSTEVQSIIFDKSMYSVTEAKKWLRDNSFVAPKVDKTDRYLRFRQKQPSYFDESSFRTIPFGKNTGIKAIIGVPMKHNPFYQESDTPTGDGHRIGAYAMLFTKAKNKYLLAVSMGAGDSAEAQMELAKAKQYWDLYQMARKDYPTIEERKGSDILLHEYTSFAKAIKSELPKRNNPMKTHKNPVIDGKVLVANMKGLRKLYTGLEYHTALNRITETLEPMSLEFGIPVTVTEQTGTKNGSKYKVAFISSYMGDIAFVEINNKRKHLYYLSCKPHLMSSKGRIDLDSLGVVSDEQLAKSQYKIEEYRSNPHCHCYGAKKNPHCAVHGNPRKRKSKEITSLDDLNMLLDRLKMNHLIYSPDWKSDIKKYDRQLKTGVWDWYTEKEYSKKDIVTLLEVFYGNKKNPYGTAMVQGSMGGLAYRYNPTKKIMDFDSFMDHLEDGNVFVGRYVVFVQNGVPMRLEIGSSTPKEVSPEVAFYADLAGQAELVGTSDIDTFSDDYRLLIRQASDAARGGFVAGGGVPVIEVEEIVVPTPALTDPALEALEELETIFKYAQDLRIQNATELERASDNLKYYLREALKVGKRSEKKVISRLQILADSKRAKNPETLTEKIIARYIKFAEKSIGAKIDIVDDETGKKTTPKKEAEKIIEEIQADPDYRPQFDMQKRLVEGGIIQTPKVMKAPFDIEEEEIVAPAPAPDPNSVEAILAAMAKQQADFIGGLKKNPRNSHYAYRMSTLDHNHRMNRTALNNVFIKKNPSDAFRFPQVEVLGVNIDNDIYTWLSSSLPNWDSVIPLLTGEYAKYKQSVETLANQAKQLMVEMQTEIVPAVEARVKKALATGKTLKDILGQEKKNNPYRTNTKRQRRYY